MNDLVTIIVPVYNVEKYINKCLGTLVKQTYKNIEIIVINDGSSDNSQKIIDEFCHKYPRIIKAYKKSNGGISSTRNFGIEKANGKYIVFVDIDDYVESDYCEFLYKLIIKYDVDVACCDYFINDSNNNVQFISNEKVLTSNDMLCDYLYNANIKGCVWNKMYKASIIKNIKFLDFKMAEDVIFNTEVLLNCKKIVYSHVPKYHYNTLNTSLSRSKLNYKKIKDCMDAHDIQFNIIKSQNDDKLECKVIQNKYNAIYEYYLDIDKDTNDNIVNFIKNSINDCKKKYKKYEKCKNFSKKVYFKMILTSKLFKSYRYIYNLIFKR